MSKDVPPSLYTNALLQHNEFISDLRHRKADTLSHRHTLLKHHHCLHEYNVISRHKITTKWLDRLVRRHTLAVLQ